MQILALFSAVIAFVACLGVWCLWRHLRYTTEAFTDARECHQVTRQEFQQYRDVTNEMLGDLQDVTVAILHRMADQVECAIGHRSEAFLLQSLAQDAQRGRWFDVPLSSDTRQRAIDCGVSLPEHSCNIGTVFQVATAVADRACHLEESNLEIARLCRIEPFEKARWLADMLSRHERLCGSWPAARDELDRLIQRRDRSSSTILEWRALA